MIVIKDKGHFYHYLLEAFVGDRIEDYQNDPFFHSEVQLKINVLLDLLEKYNENKDVPYQEMHRIKQSELYNIILNNKDLEKIIELEDKK
jgi:hypothetical protein